MVVNASLQHYPLFLAIHLHLFSKGTNQTKGIKLKKKRKRTVRRKADKPTMRMTVVPGTEEGHDIDHMCEVMCMCYYMGFL